MALKKNSVSTSGIPADVLFFFDVGGAAGAVVYQCRKCPSKPKQAWKPGYPNLRKHLISCVGQDYMEKFARAKRGQANPLGFEREKFISSRELSVFRWIEWIIMREMPLSESDNPLTREMSQLDPVCSNSLMLYITYLVPLVEAKIADILPLFVGIMFDGWTNISTHYIGIIATFMENGVYYEVLLGCSPPLNEKSYTADEHYALLEAVLSIFGKPITSPSVIIGDNCATNKALADLMKVPLIGCGCHKLNLAVKAYLARRPAIEKTIERVDKIVSQLRNLKAAGALRELTWSSTYKMLHRFLRLDVQARQLDDVDTIRRADAERIKTVMPSLKNFKSVMTDLQKQGQHIGTVHDTFKMMTEDYPELKNYLAADAAISHSPEFEAATVKIINGEQDSLTDREKARVSCFLVREPSEMSETQEADNTRSYACQLRLRKRQRLMPGEDSAKHVLRATRKRLTPVNFEKLLFLKHNRHLWNADMVAQAMKAASAAKQ
uniref:BED-type domain-containing protein n=1 Tax=Phytophthora ramorum TaxID=164328 RepID=H3H8T4_PHYRM